MLDRRTALKCLWSLFAVAVGLPAFADVPGSDGNFKAIYGDIRLKDQFYLFLQNVFRLYPENRFHQLITDAVAQNRTDEQIYQTISKKLPEIKTFLSSFTYALPALKKQKEEMAKQTATLLQGVSKVDGYVEIGTTGRYYGYLKDRVAIEGPLYVVNDLEPRYSPEDIMERGRLPKIGTFVPLGNYDPLAGTRIPENSVELVTNYIGFHHSPTDRLEGFARSLWKVLKPGGKLVVRDHDVDRPEMKSMVALAHDVFNAGVGLTWAQNHEQIRNFTSVAQLEQTLSKVGFKREGSLLLQAHDPTKNTLMIFTKA